MSTPRSASPELRIEDGVASIRLNRAEHGNALDLATAREMRAIIDSLHGRTDLRAVVLTADGKLFCAGGDIREMAAAADRGVFVRELADTVHQALISMRALPVPVLAAVQGTAAGAGIGLILAADIVIASDEARFAAAYGNIGLSPDCGVSALLPAVIGPRRAALLTLTDLVLDAATAVEWGLITECCPAAELCERVSTLLARVTTPSAAAGGAAALLLRNSVQPGYPARLADEVDNIARLAGTSETALLLNAFTQPSAAESTEPSCGRH